MRKGEDKHVQQRLQILIHGKQTKERLLLLDMTGNTQPMEQLLQRPAAEKQPVKKQIRH